VSDFDSPWKEALDLYFESFLAFFFPQAHIDIDWSRDSEALEKELQQVIREAALGPHRADKLVKVWLHDGEEAWILIHVEVQSQEEAEFPRRMFTYNTRIFDLYNHTVVSFAVLGDDRASWRPDRFGYARWGCEVGIRFPVVKLLDYAADVPGLEANPNPFAAMVLAHLKTRETHHDPDTRCVWKIRLIKGLYERGLSKENVRDLFRMIDWMMDLPEAQYQRFWQEMQQYEKEKHVPYITSVERHGMERGKREGLLEGKREGLVEGKREGLLEGITSCLKLRFGAEGVQLLPAIQSLSEVDRLQAILRALETAADLDEVRRLCA
jgi:hypothetical protein